MKTKTTTRVIGWSRCRKLTRTEQSVERRLMMTTKPFASAIGCMLGLFIAGQAAHAQNYERQELAAIHADREATVQDMLYRLLPADAKSIQRYQFEAALRNADAKTLLAAGNTWNFEQASRILLHGTSSSARSLDPSAAQKAIGDLDQDMVYTPDTPCRIVDTRPGAGGSGVISGGTSRDFYVYGDGTTIGGQGGNSAGCASPNGEPRAVHINATVVPPANGFLTVYPADIATLPVVSLLNYQAGVNIANAGVIQTAFDLTIEELRVYANGNTQVIIDVLGYFHEVDAIDPALLSFGNNNTRAGNSALGVNTTGIFNTAFGSQALFNNTTGDNNTAVGTLALVNNTLGDNNTAVGNQALFTNTGIRNTAVGNKALIGNTIGQSNIGIGYLAGKNLTTGNANIMIGHRGVGNDTLTIRIGELAQTRTFIAGIRDRTTGVNDATAVVIDSAGQLGTISSSRRYKEEIHDMAAASERLLSLRPVTFRYKKAFEGGDKPMQFGLIAEEVAEVFPELVVYNDDGAPEAVKYRLLSTLLLNELQKQGAELRDMQARLVRLEIAKAGAVASIQ